MDRCVFYLKQKIKYFILLLIVLITIISFSYINYINKKSVKTAELFVIMDYDSMEEKENVFLYRLEHISNLTKDKYSLILEKSFQIDDIKNFDRNFRLIKDKNTILYSRNSKNELDKVLNFKDPYVFRFPQIIIKDMFTKNEVILSYEGYGMIHPARDNPLILADNYYLYFFYGGLDVFFMKTAANDLLILNILQYNKYFNEYKNELSNVFADDFDHLDLRLHFFSKADTTKTRIKIENDIEANLFNPLINNNIIAISSFSTSGLFMNFNQYNYLNNKKYVKSIKDKYDSIHTDNNLDANDVMDYGWKILVIDQELSNNTNYMLGKELNVIRNYPIYPVCGKINKVMIPYKCWSPDGDQLLFVGSQDKPWNANVYILDINSDKITKIFEEDDNSGEFNPNLDWTKHGILITLKDNLFLKRNNSDLEVVFIQDEIEEYSYGKLSLSGEKIMFFGKNKNGINLYVIDLTGKILIKKKMQSNDIANFQGAWIADKISMIKNEADYYTIPDGHSNDYIFNYYIESIRKN